MGPTLGNNGKILSFIGVKGGVGCSIVSALLARVLSKRVSKKVALVDAFPSTYSLLPAYLSATPSNHCLLQLLPYQEHLTSKMIENYFPLSPEGVAYIPIRQDDETPLLFPQVFSLLQKTLSWFDILFLDVSSFPNDQYLLWIEKCQKTFFVSSLEPTSLTAVGRWEKRLLPHQFDLKNFGIIFNQESATRPIPRDISTWSQHFSCLGNVPFLGEDFSIQLHESPSLNTFVEKALAPLAEKLDSVLKIMRAFPTPGLEKKDNETDNSSSNANIPLDAVHNLHQKLLETLRRSGALKDQKSELLQRQILEPAAREILDLLIQDLNIPNRSVRQRLAVETLNLAFGLGPLEPLLQNEDVTEIMVNGPERVYIEKKGMLEQTDIRFFNEQQLRTVIERILAPIGRRIDESQPYVDGRLLDGSRVNAVIPPLSLNGPTLTIRKFSKRKLGVEDLVRFGSLTQEAADFLGACVLARKNIVVSGGTGSGKTTLLNILSNYIPSNERIVTIEDSAELQLSQEHVVRLEGRPANLEGKGQITIRDLVINALRMRPDRIVVGEVRGGEALDMLQAMNTGHDGSLTTAHANSPRDVLSRLETMALFTGLELPLRAIREQIARAIHLVVQQSRLADGKRAVTQISEIQGMEGDVIILQDLFMHESGKGPFDELRAGLVRRPFAPSFLDDLKKTGYAWPGHGKNA